MPFMIIIPAHTVHCLILIINKFNFPIYGVFILLSLTIGMIFNYIYLRKNKIGALIVIEREISLREYIEPAKKVYANLTDD